jgi:4-amino-4-deoxy-L-arabinose transferase-like glycosyltransferase
MWRFDPVAFDSAGYFELAELIRAGRWSDALASDFPPLYPILIAAAQWPGWSAATAGLVIALTTNLCVLLPLMAISRLAFGETAALATGFLWAIHPLAIRLGVQALTDAPTAFLVALALWAGFRALNEGGLVWAVGAGVSSGMAYLLRPEGIEPALALAAFYTLHGLRSAHIDEDSPKPASALKATSSPYRKKVSRRAVWAVAPLAGWALIASPYIIHISAETGSMTLSKKKSTSSFVRSMMPAARDATRSQGVTQPSSIPATRVGQGSPLGGLRHTARNIYEFQKPLVNGIHPLVLFFGLLGTWSIWAQKAQKPGRARVLLLSLLALHFAVLVGLAATHGAGYLGGHHFFLMVLYALPFAGAGLAWTLTWAAGRVGGPRWLPAVGLAALVAIPVGWLATRGVDRGVAVRPAAEWIRSQVVGTPVIVTNVAKLTYHAGAERVELSGTYEEILQRSKARSAQFVVFYPDLLPNVSPDFLTRLEGSDLELVQTFREPSRRSPGQRLVIYRLRSR